jgi:cysteine protease ATG4
MPQSVGMIGGKPSQALYFIGYTGDDVVFLDPHVTQHAVDLDELVDGRFDDASYHPETCSRMNFLVMDPSLAVVIIDETTHDSFILSHSFVSASHVRLGPNGRTWCSGFSK